ncbi:MAG TPA: NADP-dependent oxidoreductase [Candidatus Angelobacter sp.]|jgi:NADPH:quinone reductase-like Zn-dependent oxidoreductase|nr:NADP-dependent oxidoreductase [Candidatus Angelobacter sp.]
MPTKIPNSMRAAAIDRFGGPAVLKLHTLPVPPIDADEVLIALHTSGVGVWDADMRSGWWPFGKPHFPVVLGTDGSGTVAAVGARIRRFKVGDKVYAYKWEIGKGGFYAEYVAVPGEDVAHVPKPLDLRHAGAIPVTGLTSLQGIDDALHLKKGQSIIIHGASGGVGTMAVQFAKSRGARVFATASGRDGVALVRRLGADMAVDGLRGNILEAAQQFAPGGVDCVLAFAGNKLAECLKALKRGGLLAHPNGVEPTPPKRKGLKIIAYDGVAGGREFEKLNRAVEATRLKVPIAAVYPLAQAARAHQHLAAGHVLGKVVLRIR